MCQPLNKLFLIGKDSKHLNSLQKRKLALVCRGAVTAFSSTNEELLAQVGKICQQCHARHLSTEKDQLRRSMNKSFRGMKLVF